MDLTPQKIFDWVTRLTAQSYYQSLTRSFLTILNELPEVKKAIAYEVFVARRIRVRIDEVESSNERLIKRFPLDFTAASEEDDFDFDTISEGELLKLIPAQGGEQNSELHLYIKAKLGPDRLIVLKGDFNKDSIEVFRNLATVYRNQVLLHDSKERDLLTALPDRHSFDLRLLQVCEYFREHPVEDFSRQRISWIAVLDIDHFKSINDNFGHLYGDEVLVIFSQLMEKTFRYNDYLFRFGGEEFVVILNLATKDEAEIAFNRFRQVVDDFDFPIISRKVTVSVGVTHIDGYAMPTTLLDRADKALYYIKEHGRNQVLIYENMPCLQEDDENFTLVAGDEIQLF